MLRGIPRYLFSKMYHNHSRSQRFQNVIVQEILRFQDVPQLARISRFQRFKNDFPRFTRIYLDSKITPHYSRSQKCYWDSKIMISTIFNLCAFPNLEIYQKFRFLKVLVFRVLLKYFCNNSEIRSLEFGRSLKKSKNVEHLIGNHF